MASRRPFLLTAYSVLCRLAWPLFHLLFYLRARSGKEISARRGERFGFPGMPHPGGPVVWLHAASVGETTSVLALAERLQEWGFKVLLTTVTVTAADLASKRLNSGMVHQFAPYDNPVFLRRFLAHWQPEAVLVVESEIWPNMFAATARAGIPLVLVNARLSERSFRRWSCLGQPARALFGRADLVLAQNATDAERFSALGAPKVEVPGNLKFDTSALEADAAAVDALQTDIGARPVWMAALTHPGEEEIALTAHRHILRDCPNALLVLVPRHPHRAESVAALVKTYDYFCAVRSLSQTIASDTNVYLGDTLGEMGLYYRLSKVVFLGGSFTDAGGHNPVEAALLNNVLITGPKVANARAVYKALWEADAALRVVHPEELATAVLETLQAPEAGTARAARARDIVLEGRGALQNTLDQLAPLLGKELV